MARRRTRMKQTTAKHPLVKRDSLHLTEADPDASNITVTVLLTDGTQVVLSDSVTDVTGSLTASWTPGSSPPRAQVTKIINDTDNGGTKETTTAFASNKVTEVQLKIVRSNETATLSASNFGFSASSNPPQGTEDATIAVTFTEVIDVS
jgi:hypothetical protein